MAQKEDCCITGRLNKAARLEESEVDLRKSILRLQENQAVH